MKKKLFGDAMCALMLCVAVVPAFAAESAIADDEVIVFEVVEAPLSDGRTRASWGTGKLYASDPLFSKPQAYAYTSTYAGTAYKVTALVSVKDANGDTYSSATTTNNNSADATSATIVSKTSSCTFTGTHKMQDTSTSGWQSATTTKSY